MSTVYPCGDPRTQYGSPDPFFYPGYHQQPPQTVGHYFSGFDGQRIDDLIKAINRLAEAMEAKK